MVEPKEWKIVERNQAGIFLSKEGILKIKQMKNEEFRKEELFQNYSDKFEIDLLFLMKSDNCSEHNQSIKFMCLDEECKARFLLCQQCKETIAHKHSKTSIVQIENLQKQLGEAWEIEDNPVHAYQQKFKEYFKKLRKQISDIINQDEKQMHHLLQKISYFHLPKTANSQVYLRFKKSQLDDVDKLSMISLINEAENGEINKDPSFKEIFSLLDNEIKKVSDKIRTVKMILPAQKLQTELLLPRFSQNSRICSVQDLAKLYGIFNSKNLLIRSGSLVYRGSDHDFQSKAFYNRCNDIKNCVALCKLQNERIVGGYSSLPLVYHEEEKMDEQSIQYGHDLSLKSFLFSLTNVGSFNLKDSKKAIGYLKGAIGPIFGKDLNVSKREVQSELGNSYRNPRQQESQHSKAIFLGGEKVKLRELEIWELSF